MGEATLQAFADDVVAPEHRQPLKTVEQACLSIGWDFVDRPVCCGVPVNVESWLGAAIQAECPSCGKFIADVTAPVIVFDGSAYGTVDAEKFAPDTDWSRVWISGRRTQPGQEG